MRTVKLGRCLNLVNISEEERKEGIILQFEDDAFDDGCIDLEVYLVKATKATEEVKRIPIDGHPNCYVGDCYHCRNVACGIQQGYEKIPE